MSVDQPNSVTFFDWVVILICRHSRLRSATVCYEKCVMVTKLHVTVTLHGCKYLNRSIIN